MGSRGVCFEGRKRKGEELGGCGPRGAGQRLTPPSSGAASPPPTGRGRLGLQRPSPTSSLAEAAHRSPNCAWHSQRAAVPVVCTHVRTHLHTPRRTQAPQGETWFRRQLSFPICKMGSTAGLNILRNVRGRPPVQGLPPLPSICLRVILIKEPSTWYQRMALFWCGRGRWRPQARPSPRGSLRPV